MTAKDELRAMSGYPHTLRPELHKALEDAGIDYWVAQGLTFWNCEDGRECVAYGYQTNDGPKLAMKIVGFTSPAQVIAATLGADEYAIEHNVDGSYKCPKCGCVVDYDVRGDDERVITMDDYVIPFNFCPKCGAEVVDE